MNLNKSVTFYFWAGIAGLVYPLGFSPISFWPASIFSISLLYYLLQHPFIEKLSIKCWKLTALFGFSMFAVGTSWIFVSINQFGGASVFLASIITIIFTLYLTVYPLLIGWGLDKSSVNAQKRPYYFAALFIFLWLLSDGLRGWVFSGFPWLYLGYSAVNLPITGFAPLIGVHGLTLLLLVIAIAFSQIVFSKKWLPLTLIGTIFAVGFLLQQISWSTPVGPKKTLSLIQPNIPQDLKWEPNHLRNILHKLDKMTLVAKGGLVIWPESALPVFADNVANYLKSMAMRSRLKQQQIITGVPVRKTQNNRYFGAAMLLNPDNILQSQTYLKRRLVPFGEYVPLENTLRGIIKFFNLPMSGFSLGPDNQKALQINGLSLGVAICYEIAYPHLVYDQTRQSNVILTISNDAWFGHSLGPWQHLEMARMRAIETQLAVIRDTNNGITAMINAKGQVEAMLPQFEAKTLETSFQPAVSHAPIQYYHFYAIFIIFLGLLLLVLRKNGYEQPRI